MIFNPVVTCHDSLFATGVVIVVSFLMKRSFDLYITLILLNCLAQDTFSYCYLLCFSGLEIVNASRCFNCGSYNHSMKECPKPRDNAAVNNARKQHKSKRNQNASSRNPTRYYQDSPGGKYGGLRSSVLDAETRQLLGLGVNMNHCFCMGMLSPAFASVLCQH